MTREQIIELLKKDMKERGKCLISKALEVAIESLEQEEYYKDLAQSYEKTIVKLTEAIAERAEQKPCEDCVSRQAVIDGINKYFHDEYYQRTSIQDCRDCLIKDVIKDLPPVTPTKCIAKINFDKDDLKKLVDEKVQELVTHGTCKDCSRKQLDKEESEEVGAEKYFCPVVCGYVDETPDFYCEKFEKGGSENEH